MAKNSFYHYSSNDFIQVAARDLCVGDSVSWHAYSPNRLNGAITIQEITELGEGYRCIEFVVMPGMEMAINNRDNRDNREIQEVRITWQGTTPIIVYQTWWEPGRMVRILPRKKEG